MEKLTMNQLRHILVKEYEVNHLTLDILDAFSSVNEKAAAAFLRGLYKRDMINLKIKKGGYYANN